MHWARACGKSPTRSRAIIPTGPRLAAARSPARPCTCAANRAASNGAKPWANSAAVTPVSTSPVPPVAMPGLPVAFERHALAVADHGAVPFEHDHGFRSLGQLPGQRLALVERHLVDPRQPGKLARVRGENPRAARFLQRVRPLGQGVERVGIDHQRQLERLIQPGYQVDQFVRPPQARPAGNDCRMLDELLDRRPSRGRDPARGVLGQRDRHVRRLERGDRRLNRLGRGDPDQSGAGSQSRHPGQRDSASHPARPADEQRAAEAALVAVGQAAGQTRQRWIARRHHSWYSRFRFFHSAARRAAFWAIIPAT